MNRTSTILALLAVTLVGCDESSQLVKPGDVPITPTLARPGETAAKPAKPKVPATAATATAPGRDKAQPPAAKTKPAVRASLLPRPLTSTAPPARQKTLTQTDPNLLRAPSRQTRKIPSKPRDPAPAQAQTPAPASVGGDKPAVRQRRLDNPPARPIELTALGEDTPQRPTLSTPTIAASLDRVEAKDDQPADIKPKPASLQTKTHAPRLAPIAVEEQFEEDLAGYPGQADGSVDPQDLPQGDVAPEADETSPWNLEKIREDKQEQTAAQAVAKREIDELDVAPPEPDEPIVMNQAKVVAGLTLQVNNRYINADEILAALHQSLLKIPKRISREDFSRQAGRLINRQITYQIQQVLVSEEANRYLEEGAKEQIKMEMAETLRDMIARSGGSEEKLKQKCRQEGTTLLDILKAQRMNLTVSVYLRSKFYPVVVVNRRMLWNYYRKNRSEFVSPKKVQMQIIAAPWRAFVPVGDKQATPEEQDEARSEARELIQDAWRELQSGKDFGDVARRLSRGVRAKHGGLWPMMSAGNFRNAQVESVAFALAQGRYSKVIEAPSGFYIVKAKDIVQGKEVPFEQAQEEIEQKLRMEQFIDLRANYMKDLYDRATIGDIQSFLILTVDRAVQKYYR